MMDPSTGRFLTEDPIGFAGGDMNLYRYVGNNPVNYVDPSGLQSIINIAFRESFNRGEPQAAARAVATVASGVAVATTAPFVAATAVNITPTVATACALNPKSCASAATFGTGVIEGFFEADFPPDSPLTPRSLIFEELGKKTGRSLRSSCGF